MPKIAYLTPLANSSAEACLKAWRGYPSDLARGVARASGGVYQVEVIAVGLARARVELEPGVCLRVIPAASNTTNPRDVLSWDLPEALGDADLVHVFQPYTRSSEVGLLVAKFLRKPVCVTDFGADTSIIGRYYGIIDLADQIVAYSNLSASGFDGRRSVEVIQGCVDAEAFTPSQTETVRSHVLYVGGNLSHHGIDRLISAMRVDVPLVIRGRSHRPEDFDRLLDLPRGKNIRLVTDPTNDDILALYRRAWVTVISSGQPGADDDADPTDELVSSRLLESMACGTPVIAPNRSGIFEFIRGGETGFVFDSIDELCDQIELLVSNPTLVSRMGAQARRSIETQFSLDVAGTKLMRLYESLLSAREGGEAAG